MAERRKYVFIGKPLLPLPLLSPPSGAGERSAPPPPPRRSGGTKPLIGSFGLVDTVRESVRTTLGPVADELRKRLEARRQALSTRLSSRLGGYYPPPPSPEKVLICPKCGEEVKLGFDYCPHCGARLPKPQRSPTEAPPSRAKPHFRMSRIQL